MINFLFLGPFGRFVPEENEEGYWVVDGAGKTVAEVVNTTEVVNSKMNYSVLVNDVRADQDYVMKDGDEVAIMPLFSAG